MLFFFFQAEDGIRGYDVTGVQTCALPICIPPALDETLQEHSEIQYDYLLHIASLSPLIRVVDLVSESLGGARYRITASIQNQGGVATYVTQRAIDIRRDKPVVVAIEDRKSVV